MPKDLLRGKAPSEPPYTALPSSFLKWLETKKRKKPFSKEELKDLRKEYKRLYHKAYYYKRKKNNHQTVVRMTVQEHKTLNSLAKKHNKSLNVFMKESALAYANKSYMPRDPKQIDSVLQEIRKAGNNINQIAHQINKMKYRKVPHSIENEMKVIDNSFQTLLRYVEKIEIKAIEGFKSTPSTLKQELNEIVKIEPQKADELITFLQKKKRSQKNS